MNVPEKRGVLTSLGLREGEIKGSSPPKSPPRKQVSREKKVVVSHYTQAQPVVVTRPAHTNMTVEELNNTKYGNSLGYSITEKPETHFTYSQGIQSNFVPPPPQQFLINSSHTVSQPSQLPVHSNPTHGQTIQIHEQQPMANSIRRTFIPHHIYNQIPVVATETKRIEIEREEEEEGLNEADERMLEQYEKLYGNYVDEKTKNEHLIRQIRQLEVRINEQPRQTTQVREVTKEVFVDKPKRIDIRMLASLIANKNKVVIHDVVERRKQNCLAKIRELMSQEESAMRTTIVRSSEEIVRVKTR